MDTEETRGLRTTNFEMDLEKILGHTKRLESNGQIDSLNNIKDQKVFVFFGKKDRVPPPEIVDKLAKFYEKLGAKVKYQLNFETAHPFPTDLPDYTLKEKKDTINKA